MTCVKIESGYICYHSISFEFRFLFWRCEFSAKGYCGPLWYLSIPGLKLLNYFRYNYSFDGLRIWRWEWEREYLEPFERDFYPGEHNPLWYIFDYHYNKWINKKEGIK